MSQHNLSANVALTLTDAPDDAALAAIDGGLGDYNLEKAGYRDYRPLAVLLTAEGAVIGGLSGRTTLGLLFVDTFFVPERLRGSGIGARVLAMAEAEARARGCTAATLFTIEFQAPGFYQKQGYRVVGRIEVDPPGASRYCLSKRLVSPLASRRGGK